MARALDELCKPEHRVTHLTDKFPANTPDEEWISKLAFKADGDWVLVSGDKRITRSKHECRAWHEAHLTAFFLKKGWMNQTFWHQAARIVTWWPIIINQAETIEKGIGFLVPFKGAKLQILKW